MSVAAVEDMDTDRPVIMFIDDEPRVLKSMRAMFRRDYAVHLANSGADALKILAGNSIDVVVSDQRMPEMTGVEVLTEIKKLSPDTVRILLTGYADLAAVEASMNDAEVFKYLMKPCPADEVRGAVQAGLELRNDGEPLSGVVTVSEAPPSNVMPLKPVAKTIIKPVIKDAPVDKHTESVQVLLLSSDKTLADGVVKACASNKLHHAPTLKSALALIQQHPIGVVVTDMAIDEREVNTLGAAVRRVTPEMVVILVSDQSDASVLIKLINSGEVFRFLLKPLQLGQCKIWIASALRKFVANGGDASAVSGPGTSQSTQKHSAKNKSAQKKSGQKHPAQKQRAHNQPGAWTRFKNWLLGASG